MAGNPLSGRLQEILTAKLSAGNKICETWTGDWPFPGSKIIILERPFLTSIRRELEGCSSTTATTRISGNPTTAMWEIRR